ncbi:TetR/AcrR family transcriptional regulator [Streptomyces armeniacus]|uniref:TetR/AcrR family transcriptional regulator n=1 Tax=Streptomyces armeniacus TaxID=83291 RepID=UPI001AD826D8|nr:TetR/AcrR family transcriptional regulator [Streptomyces armeniacus]
MTRSPASRTQRRRYAPRRPREVRSAQIIDAAARLIAEHGWRGMTMERVAAEADVAKSVSYAIFESQAGLQRAVLLRAQEVTGDRVARALAAAREADGIAAAFHAGLGVYLESVAREPEISRLVLLPIEGAPDSVREAIRDGREQVRRRILAVVRTLLEREGAAELDAELISHLVRDNAEHLARLLLEQPGTFTPRRLTDATAALARFARHG